jgi:hypothetical protein
MTSPWWAAFGPAETDVSCGTGTHRVRWADGRLQAADHPDAEGELVLAALGADATPCLDLAQAWGKHSDDLAVLAIGPRSAADQLTLTAAALRDIVSARSRPGWRAYTATAARSQFIRSGHLPARPRRPTASSSSGGSTFRIGHAHLTSSRGQTPGGPAPASPASRLRAVSHAQMLMASRSEDPARLELMELLALGTPFQLRLAGAVAHAWSADGLHGRNRGQAGPALTAALAGRLAPAAAQWLGLDPADVDATIHDGAGWGDIALAHAAGRRGVQARLPVSWLATVWAPGLAFVSGCLIVAVQDAAWPDARVLALRAPGREPVELSIRHDGRGWVVAP